MKYISLLILSLGIVSLVYSQNVIVSDDTTYNGEASAVLDVKSDNKGFLAPRMALDDASTADPVTNPAEGLMIYNDGGLENEGYWYWTGTNWAQIVFTDPNGFSTENKIYGEVYEIGPHTYTSIILNNAGVFVGWVSASQGDISGSTYLNFQENSTADRLVVGTDGAGKYRITLTSSFGGSSGPIITGAIFKNGVIQNDLVFKRNLNSNGDVGNATLSGIIDLQPGDYIDVRFAPDTNGERVDIYLLNLQVIRIAE
jgi:hypothetical protein